MAGWLMGEPQAPSCCLTNSPSSSGELGAGSAKNWAMRSLIAGLASALLVSAFSAWMMSFEVPAGAKIASQGERAEPWDPGASAKEGSLGVKHEPLVPRHPGATRV